MAGRKKLDRSNLHARVSVETTEKLKELAQRLGYIYNDEGSIGQMLDAIASNQLILISPFSSLKAVDTFSGLSYYINIAVTNNTLLSGGEINAE